MILPGQTLGMLGGGQLGRMFTMAARTMGYRVIVLEPAATCPAGEVANRFVSAAYDDRAALEALGRECAAISTEFENVPADSLRFLEQFCPVRPGADCVAIAQDRRAEKSFMTDNGFGVGPYAVINDASEIPAALEKVRLPAVLKAARFGYDGKGQAIIREAAELAPSFEALGNVPCVLEEFLNLKVEISVIVARGANREIAVHPVSENQHVNGILDLSIVPARISPALAQRAQDTAVAIVEKMNYCGVMGVEFFVLEDETLYVNEIAPRPHNSGHYSQDACVTSQFEQQVRAICGVKLGDTRLTTPAVMLNLLGDLWNKGEPDWNALFSYPSAKLHLYGKHKARPGRKMAHVNCLDTTIDQAMDTALAIKHTLSRNAGII